MSRRKQARPRLCKRDEEEDEEGLSGLDKKKDGSSGSRVYHVKSDEEMDNGKTMGTDDAREMVDTEKVDIEDSSNFRCETCGAVFENLDQFMDHRNFDCVPGLEGEHQWTIENLAMNIGSTDTPSSPDSYEKDESFMAIDSPLSPETENIAPEELPGGIGKSQINPYGCQFCDKAFPRLRYLKIHEQIHDEQLPFKCTFCTRRFRHKRSRDRHIKLHTGDKRFKCNQCDSAFARSDHLKSHMKTHDSSKPYQCVICKRGFVTMAMMTSHMLSHKKAGNHLYNFRCLQCQLSFTSSEELQIHLSGHEAERLNDKTLQCSHCMEKFLSQGALDVHLEQEHSGEQQFKCHLCSEVLLNSVDLYHHMNIHESMPREKTPSSDVEIINHCPIPNNSVSGFNQPIQKDLLVCPYCFCSDFESLEMLEIHMQSVHGVKPAEVYTCNYCNAPYKNLYSLHEHMRAVHQNQPCLDIKYPCSRCSRQFGSIETLIQHKRALHPNEHRKSRSELMKHSQSSRSSRSNDTPKVRHASSTSSTHSSMTELKIPNPGKEIFMGNGNRDPGEKFQKQEEITCDQCNATFHDFNSFQIHMKHHVDSSLSHLACKHCSQVFSSEDQLEKHASSHYLSMTTEYGCTTCMKLFTKPDELQKHLMDIHAHHLYRCALCKEIFDSKVNIQVHFAIKHSNECKLFKCTKCDSVFRSEMEWQVHVRVNHLHVAKPYRCLFCKESFTTEMDLQCHLTTHNRPFRCTMCDESFHVEYLRDRHMQSCHSSPSERSQSILSPNQQDMQTLGIKVEKDFDMSNYVAAQERVHMDPSPRFSPKHSPGIWKSSELLHTCNICDIKFAEQSMLLTHKAVDHGLSAKKKSSASSPVQCDRIKEEIKISPLKEQLLTDSLSVMSTSIATSITSMANSLETSTSPAATMSLPVVVVSDKLNMACMYCSQTFRSRNDLDKHMKIHLNSGIQKCNICDQVFPSSSILAEHKLTHCKIQQGNLCVLCKMPITSEEQFYVHTQEHGFQNSYMQCLICRQTLVSMVELQMHGKHHFQLNSGFFTCCVCLKSFDSKENLVSKLNSSGRTYYVCKPCYHGEKNEHACQQCNAKFLTSLQLEAHSATHKKSYQCIKCQESFSSEYEIQMHVATHVMKEGNIHQCKLCSRTFESPAKLQCHLIDHTYKNSEFRCSVCCKIFNSAQEIQMHAVEHGLDARRYACNLCNQRFFFSAELENHKFTHSDSQSNGPSNKKGKDNSEKQPGTRIVESDTNQVTNNTDLSHSPGDLQNGTSEKQQIDSPVSEEKGQFVCSECKKVFLSAVNLNNHKKIHEKKEQNFKCSLCSDTFSTMVELQQHFFSDHSNAELETSKKSFPCPECDQTFPCLSNLQGHLRIHKTGAKFPCPVCNKVFALSRNLNIHMRSHSGEKPYECPICPKRFARKENRKAHMRSHGGTKPFLCPVCGKSFTRKCHVKEHMRLHFSSESNVSFDEHSIIEVDINSDNNSADSDENTSIDMEICENGEMSPTKMSEIDTCVLNTSSEVTANKEETTLTETISE